MQTSATLRNVKCYGLRQEKSTQREEVVGLKSIQPDKHFVCNLGLRAILASDGETHSWRVASHRLEGIDHVKTCNLGTDGSEAG